MLVTKRNLISVLILFISLSALSQENPDQPKVDSNQEKATHPEKKYAELQKDLLRGWNTWDNRSIMTHVLLPEVNIFIIGEHYWV